MLKRPPKPSPRLYHRLRQNRQQAMEKAIARYGSYLRVPNQLRSRLDREPIVQQFGKRQPSTNFLVTNPAAFSKTMLFMGGSKNPKDVESAIRMVHPFILRHTFEEFRLSPSARKAVRQVFLQFDFNDVQELLYDYIKEQKRLRTGNTDSTKTVYRDTFNFVKAILASQIRHGLTLTKPGSFKEKPEVLARQIAGRYLINFTHYLSLQPDFTRSADPTNKKWGQSVKTEPGFQSFFRGVDFTFNAHLYGKKRWPHYVDLEELPLVERPKGLEVHLLERNLQLLFYPYDATKVVQTTLVNAKGQELDVVIKRLSPIKSVHAEEEFNSSKEMYHAGIPTPQPVAVIQTGGNTYFVWKKYPLLDPVPHRFEAEVEKQKRSIQSRLRRLGFKNLDNKPRNFIVTRENNQIKVMVVDAERVIKNRPPLKV